MVSGHYGEEKNMITDNDVTKAMLREAVNIEARIDELENSPDVKRARRYNEVRGQRLQYLQDLKQLEHLGKRLRDIGWEAEDAED